MKLNPPRRSIILIAATALMLGVSGGTLAAFEVCYQIPGMENALVRRDIVYKQAGNEALKLDVYLPAGAGQDGRYPTVVLIHGDGPPGMLRDMKDAGQYTSFGRLIAASGMAAVTFNHRSSLYYSKIADATGDIRDAMQYIRENGARLGLDVDRCCIWGISAGTPFVMSQILRDRPSFVRCAVVYYGHLDMQLMRDQIPQAVTDQMIRDVSPLYQLQKSSGRVPPFFIVRAGQDQPEINQGIDSFVIEALRQNIPLELHNFPEGVHGFDVLMDTPPSQALIRRTLEFVKANLASSD